MVETLLYSYLLSTSYSSLVFCSLPHHLSGLSPGAEIIRLSYISCILQILRSAVIFFVLPFLDLPGPVIRLLYVIRASNIVNWRPLLSEAIEVPAL
jgi:hypothetical protein